MSLDSLISYVSHSQITNELINRINEKNKLNVIGSSRYAKSVFINSIAKKEDKSILLISPNSEIAYKWYGYFASINSNNVLYYPPTENLPYSSINKSKEIEYSQISVLTKLVKNKEQEINIIITTERSLQPHLISRNIFNDNILNLNKGKNIEIKVLSNILTILGYKKETITSSEGIWSRRGEIVDIYPVNNELPIRIEFFDNIIDKIREYDPGTQRTLDKINNVEIVQAGNNLIIENKLKELSISNLIDLKQNDNQDDFGRYLGIIDDFPSSILDYINKETLIVIDEPDECEKFANNWYIDSEDNFNQNKDDIKKYLEFNNIDKNIRSNLHIKFEHILKKLTKFKLLFVSN